MIISWVSLLALFAFASATPTAYSGNTILALDIILLIAVVFVLAFVGAYAAINKQRKDSLCSRSTISTVVRYFFRLIDRNTVAYAVVIIVMAIFHGYGTLDRFIGSSTFLYFIIVLAVFAILYLLSGVIYITICYYFANVYYSMEEECQRLGNQLPDKSISMFFPLDLSSLYRQPEIRAVAICLRRAQPRPLSRREQAPSRL